MKKRIIAAVLATVMTLSLGVCSSGGQTQGAGGNQAGDAGNSQAEDAGGNQVGGTRSSQARNTGNCRPGWGNMIFDQMRGEAKGTTVTFYGQGRDGKLNRWLDDEFARVMREKYGITVERTPMDTNQVLSQLTGKIQTGEKDRSIDMVWINEENFQSAKKNNILYGPFTDKLPSSSNYVNGKSEDVAAGFAHPIEGYEAPCGKVQLVMVIDLAVTPDVPESTGELEESVEKYPGKVTHPALPDFTGSTFVRNIIYEICGYEQFMDMTVDKETVRTAMAPTMEYLRELSPYLWNQDAAFPDSSTTADNMFADGELVVSMTYGAYDVALNIEDGKYADTMATFQFERGTIDNTNFMTIAANSGNKAGAMVAISEMTSPRIQADRYGRLRVIPVLDNEKLSGEQKAAFDRVGLDKGTIPQDELLSKHLPEMPAQLVPTIEEIWAEEVVDK